MPREFFSSFLISTSLFYMQANYSCEGLRLNWAFVSLPSPKFLGVLFLRMFYTFLVSRLIRFKMLRLS